MTSSGLAPPCSAAPRSKRKPWSPMTKSSVRELWTRACFAMARAVSSTRSSPSCRLGTVTCFAERRLDEVELVEVARAHANSPNDARRCDWRERPRARSKDRGAHRRPRARHLELTAGRRRQHREEGRPVDERRAPLEELARPAPRQSPTRRIASPEQPAPGPRAPGDPRHLRRDIERIEHHPRPLAQSTRTQAAPRCTPARTCAAAPHAPRSPAHPRAPHRRPPRAEDSSGRRAARTLRAAAVPEPPRAPRTCSEHIDSLLLLSRRKPHRSRSRKRPRARPTAAATDLGFGLGHASPRPRSLPASDKSLR